MYHIIRTIKIPTKKLKIQHRYVKCYLFEVGINQKSKFLIYLCGQKPRQSGGERAVIGLTSDPPPVDSVPTPLDEFS